MNYVIEMTVLSDKDIDDAIQSGTLGIEPFIEKNLTPNGYDLSIDEVFNKKTDSHIKEGIAVGPPLTWFAISTKEFVKMGPQITSQLWIRSSYARKGVLASFGKVVEGMNIVLEISKAQKDRNDRPLSEIKINKVEIK